MEGMRWRTEGLRCLEKRSALLDVLYCGDRTCSMSG
jgi:hypothetical protein